MESNLITIGGVVAILGFLWKIRGDISALDRRLTERIGAVEIALGNRISVLGERVARIEGLLEGLHRDAPRDPLSAPEEAQGPQSAPASANPSAKPREHKKAPEKSGA